MFSARLMSEQWVLEYYYLGWGWNSHSILCDVKQTGKIHTKTDIQQIYFKSKLESYKKWETTKHCQICFSLNPLLHEKRLNIYSAFKWLWLKMLNIVLALSRPPLKKLLFSCGLRLNAGI